MRQANLVRRPDSADTKPVKAMFLKCRETVYRVEFSEPQKPWLAARIYDHLVIQRTYQKLEQVRQQMEKHFQVSLLIELA